MPEKGRFSTHVPVPEVPTWVDNLHLVANTAETYTVPAGCNRLLFSSTVAAYVRIGGTAAVPSADVVDGTASFGIGTVAMFACQPGTAISIVSGATCEVQIAAYATRLL